MINTTAMQPVVFLACLGAGVAAAVWYALLYVVSNACHGKRWVQLICDSLFVVGAAAMFFAVLYCTNFGQMRLYTVLAFVGGFALLYLLLRPIPARLPQWKQQWRERLRTPRHARRKTKQTDNQT